MKHVVRDASGCWLWHGDGTNYGVHGKKRAHRLSWELHQGPIPDGLMVLHGCSAFREDRTDVRGCVNPAHLRPGTAADNQMDTVRVRRMKPPAEDPGGPDGRPTIPLHMKWNDWELEQLKEIGRRECLPMTKVVRRLVREHLFAEAKL